MQFAQESLLRHHIKGIYDSKSDHASIEELNGKTWVYLINGRFEEIGRQLEMRTADMSILFPSNQN